MDALERRVARLEQIHNNIDQAQPLLITTGGAEDHFGDFLVDTAGVEMVLNRPSGESWVDFEARLHQLIVEQQRSPLGIICLFPKTNDRESDNS